MKLELHLQTLLARQEQRQSEEIVREMVAALAKTVDPLPTATVNVVLCSQEFIRNLNKQFRGKDAATDVLSFPLVELKENAQQDTLAGEIYICWSRAQQQAEELGHSWQRELAFLLAHGLLHLLGYEHGDEPNREMRQLEEKILAEMKLGDGS